MRPTLILIALLLAAQDAGAQVITIGARPTRPAYWASLGVGHLTSQSVNDGVTGTIWQFGDGLQYSGAIEYGMRGDAAFGLYGTYARVGLVHHRSESCAAAWCNATGQIAQALAQFRISGGVGFGQVIELGLGATRYTDFREDGTDVPLEPFDPVTDFTFKVGYGFGYGLSTRSQIYLVQDFVTSIHSREGLDRDASNLVQQRALRIGFRYGLGAREF